LGVCIYALTFSLSLCFPSSLSSVSAANWDSEEERNKNRVRERWGEIISKQNEEALKYPGSQNRGKCHPVSDQSNSDRQVKKMEVGPEWERRKKHLACQMKYGTGAAEAQRKNVNQSISHLLEQMEECYATLGDKHRETAWKHAKVGTTTNRSA